MEKEWGRSETNNGIPYYINHRSEHTQWDHPDLVLAMENLDTMNSIRFGAYRTAMKLRTLQKCLHLDVVSLPTVRMAFELHGFSQHNDTVMDPIQLYNILYEMYSLTKSRGRSTLNVNRCSDLLLNWILNLYDTKRTGCIRVLSVKIGVATMCAGRITEKYRYFQDLISDGSGRVAQRVMVDFMYDISQVVDNIGEGTTFGRNIMSAVDDCFQLAIGPTITQDVFYTWLLSEPQTIVWLPTMHRLSTAETMKHETKCSVCKMYPIVGLRYQCLKCLNYDLCQHCFFTGRTSKQHKYKHPTQEYCLSSSSKEDVRALAKTFRNKMSKKHGRRIKQKYRSIQDSGRDITSPYNDLNESKMETHIRLGQMADRLKAVEATIPPNMLVEVDRLSGKAVSQQTSLKSSPQSVVTATTDDTRSQDRRELEDLIDALEVENDELIEELERIGIPFQESSTDSDDEDDRDHDAALGRGSQHSLLSQQRDEIHARYEVLEEHNKQLERQLRQLRLMVHQNEDAGKNIPQVTNRIHDSQPSYHSNSSHQNSKRYPPGPERLPPYGQSEQALDRIGNPTRQSGDTYTSNQRIGDEMLTGGGDTTDGFSYHGVSGQSNVLQCSGNSLTGQTYQRVGHPYSSHIADGNLPTATRPTLAHLSSSSMSGPQTSMSPHQATPHTHTHSFDVLHRHAPFTPVMQHLPAAGNGAIDVSMTQSNGRTFQTDQSRALESMIDGRQFLPPHLADQSTVHFPKMGVSMAYPSEEAELDELVNRMTDAFPLDDDPPSPEPDPSLPDIEDVLLPNPRRKRGRQAESGDLLSAATRIGQAMTTLVSRVSTAGVEI